jgi:hypothetical protein
VSEPELKVTKLSVVHALGDGWCDHGRSVKFNLSVGYIRHADDGSVCDRWVLTHAEAAERGYSSAVDNPVDNSGKTVSFPVDET